jgi:hypothetical protein
VVAGNETTRQSIAHGMQALMDNPEAMQRLQEQPELMATATEEIMRYSSPVIHFRRTATADTELHDVRIREGDKVVTWWCRPTSTSSSSPIRCGSTSPASPTTTSPSAAAAPTSAWARTWPSWRPDHVRGAAAARLRGRADRTRQPHALELHQRLQDDAGAGHAGVKHFDPTSRKGR